MTTNTAPYDVAEFLETLEEMAAYLDACIEVADGDRSPHFDTVLKVASALGIKLSASPIEAAEPV
jgi:DNA-binding phage protein